LADLHGVGEEHIWSGKVDSHLGGLLSGELLASWLPVTA
jgi:hypothetical protein